MQPKDLIVMILAVALAICLIVTVTVPLVLGVPITDERSKALAAITTAMIAVIAFHIGKRD